MPTGVALALAAYLLFSFCDAIIKGFGSTLSVYEIAFFAALFSVLPTLFTKPKGEHWHQVLHMRRPLLVNLRAISGVIGNICIIYAFTHIPLAEAYSIAFLAPIFVVVLSTTLLGEKVSLQRWVFLAASFFGVLLVVRPGFRELELGHLLAVVAAICGSITTTVLRKVAPDEKRVSLITIPVLYILAVNGAMMATNFTMPTLHDFVMLLLIGIIGGTGSIVFIIATRMTPASQIAPGQYSQIAWALIFGAVFYNEMPDLLSYVGLAVVVVAGILNVMSDETRIKIFSRFSPGMGPSTAIAEVSPAIEAELAETPVVGRAASTGT